MELTLDSAFSGGAFVGHAGYVLLILSMLMTRMTWLRILAIGAGLLQALYYAIWLHDPVGTFWETLFTLTNVGQLAILAYRNRMARFTADERAFYETAVPSLEPRDARKLLHAGKWLEAPPGTILAVEGQPVEQLAFIVAGAVDIRVANRNVAEVGPNGFIGEISVSTGGPATATAVARTPVRYLAFDAPFLRKLLDGSDEIGRAVELAFRHGLRDKLMRANTAMAGTNAAPQTP